MLSNVDVTQCQPTHTQHVAQLMGPQLSLSWDLSLMFPKYLDSTGFCLPRICMERCCFHRRTFTFACPLSLSVYILMLVLCSYALHCYVAARLSSESGVLRFQLTDCMVCSWKPWFLSGCCLTIARYSEFDPWGFSPALWPYISSRINVATCPLGGHLRYAIAAVLASCLEKALVVGLGIFLC